MSRKSSKKGTKPPAQGASPAGTAYPVEQADLERQQARLRSAAASAAGALKPAQPPPEPPPSPAAAAVPPAVAQASTGLRPPAESGSTPHPASQPQQAPTRVETSTSSVATSAPAKPATPTKQSAEPEKQTERDENQQPQRPGEVTVTFVLLEPSARQVSLRGEFNGWSPDAHPMKRHNDGRWETTVALVPGRYEYKFFVDGQWVPDPQARENVWNYHGTLNSVLQVRS